MTICERIDAILEERGMSRRKLADMSGIPPSSLQSAIERNTGLSLDMLLPISDALGVSVESLDGTEESQSPILLSRIKLLCLESGFTYKTLEKELGFGNGVIRRWDKSSPSISAVIKVANHFNVSMDWLCALSDAKTRDCEIAAVCDYTGLDEETIALFRKLKQNPHWNEVISYILRIAEIMEG